MLRSNLGPFPAANKKSVSRRQAAINDDLLLSSYKYFVSNVFVIYKAVF